MTIAKLEAELAEFQSFMQRFRSSLRQEEYVQKESFRVGAMYLLVGGSHE